MITQFLGALRRQIRAELLCLTALLLAAPFAHAGLTFKLEFSAGSDQNGNRSFSFNPWSTITNSSGPSVPFGDYLIASPGYPTNNETSATFHYDTNGFHLSGGGFGSQPDLPTALQKLTNGNWILVITNLNTTTFTQYTFNIATPGFDSNTCPNVTITFPTNGAVVNNHQPTFTWQGPTNFATITLGLNNPDHTLNQLFGFAPSVTNALSPVTLPSGGVTVSVTYFTFNSTAFNVSTPLTGASQPFAEWDSTNQIDTGFQRSFTIPAPLTPPSGHALIAHFTFDDPGNLGTDATGNGNDYNAGGSQNGGQASPTSDAKIGGGAISFTRNDSDNFSATSQGWSPNVPPDVLSSLAESFSVSVWVKTTASIGNSNDLVFSGSTVLGADVGGLANDTVPIALTGGYVAFNTGGSEDDTLHSTTPVNDGTYHLIVVTRDQRTGLKSIYVDGVLNNSGPGTTNLLNAPQSVLIGALDDAGATGLGAGALYAGYDGKMDDLQLYSGVLGPSEVAFLFQNPGSPAPNLSGNGLVVHYAFDDTNDLGLDTSGNEFNLTFNGGNGVTFTDDAASGPGAAFFDGASYFSYTNMPTNILAAFAKDFTLALWIKTTQTDGNDTEPPYDGAGIVSADIPGSFNDIIPLALTGGTVGINTGTTNGDDNINGTNDINDGNYHQIVVTRNQATGEKQLYIDGILNNSDTAATNLLNDPIIVAIGAKIDASQSDPSQIVDGDFFTGVLDDIQLYSHVLSSGDITFLFQNPGATLGNTFSPIGLVAHYAFDNTNNVGADSSPNHFDLDFDGNDVVSLTPDAKAGKAASFDGNAFLTYNNPPPAVLAAFASDFTLSVWLKTSTTFGHNGDPGFVGAGIVEADIAGQFNDIIPMALTGSEISFGNGPTDNTLSSTTGITDGTYHHVVVTRRQSTGEKQIYIDGSLENSDFDTIDLLNDPRTIAVGAKINANTANPNNLSPQNYYLGLMDDMQIYSRVLSPSEISYLFENPGNVVPVPGSGAPVPVSITINFDLFRQQDPSGNDFFFMFPSFELDDPAPVTTNVITSPTSLIGSSSDGSAGSRDFGSLNEILGEVTNGFWTLTLNQGDPSQRVFHFTVSTVGLTSNSVPKIQIIEPARNANNVPPNSPFEWAGGPAGFGSVNVFKQNSDHSGFVDAVLPATATNWPSPPILNAGSNFFQVEYISNGFSGFTVTVPVDAQQNFISNWVTTATLHDQAQSSFTVVSSAGFPPITLVSNQVVGTNLQFSFHSSAGTTNTVQYSTNLAAAWLIYTNISGDGTVKNVTVPISIFGSSPQGFVRVRQ